MENPTKIKGITPIGVQSFSKEDFIEAYLEGDKYYLNYLLLARRVMHNDLDVRWT